VTPVRIACVQLAPRVGDGDGNRLRAREAIETSVAAGARLVVLTELCTSGYVFETEEEARSLALRPEELSEWRTSGAYVVGGFPELADDGALFNSAALVGPEGVIAVYRKTHLWDREQLYFEPGAEPPPVVETPLGRIGICVCYDLSFPEVPRGLALGGADLIAVPTNFPLTSAVPPGEKPIELVVAMAAAHVSRVFIALCDRSGSERGVDWVGATAIVDDRGLVVAGPVGPGEGTVVADCELERARDKSWTERNDALGDRRPELYAGEPAAVD